MSVLLHKQTGWNTKPDYLQHDRLIVLKQVNNTW
jgi:hypothetical protein